MMRRSARLAAAAAKQLCGSKVPPPVFAGSKTKLGKRASRPRSVAKKKVSTKKVVAKKGKSAVAQPSSRPSNKPRKLSGKKVLRVPKVAVPVLKKTIVLPDSLAPKKEKSAYKKGFKLVAGVDEAGRGPLAGPVVAAACILPSKGKLPAGLRDSKELTEPQRDAAYAELTKRKDVHWAVSIIDNKRIDEINILQATFEGMTEATKGLKKSPNYVLIDGPYVPPNIEKRYEAEPVIKGDSISPSIAAASIIAKVTRDRIMKDLHAQFPMYDFDRHKGYGTARHRELIQKHGPSSCHRLTFAPMKNMKLTASSIQKPKKGKK